MSGGRSGSVSAIAGLGLAAAISGCGGDAFTTGATDGGATGTDAGAPVGGDSGIDGALDSAVPDAGAGWCAMQSPTHTFCEDFLHGVPDKLVGITVNAMIVPDMNDPVSLPQSMAAITPKLAAKGDSATALATHDFSAATGTQFTLASYFKIASSCFPAATTSGGQPDSVSIVLVQFPAASYGIAIEVLPGMVEMFEVVTGADGGITGSPQQLKFSTANLFDRWQLWTLTINGGVPKTVALTVGTTTVIPAQTPLKGAQALFLQHPTLFLGAAVKNDQALSPGCKVNVDDILFDVRAVAMPGN